jgi:nitronate monooxygenase
VPSLLGTALPIVQAPMAGVQDAALAIAVSNAGGLGSLPCAMLSPDAMAQQLTALVRGTSAPFNVNFFCHAPSAVDPERETAWRHALRPYYDELGLDPAKVPAASARRPFSHDSADVLETIKPPVVGFHFGLPADDLLRRVRGLGAKVIASATTIDEARWLEARGVDAIIAQGVEAGGHRGSFLTNDMTSQAGTVALVRALVNAVRVPVIAAGGIADANDAAAAMSLGAAGVQVGTAYLLCPEATTSAVHRAALATAAGRQTALTNLFTGRPARGFVNRLMRDLGPMSVLAPAFPLAATAVAPLRARAEAQGRDDFSPLWAGTRAAACQPLPAATVTGTFA